VGDIGSGGHVWSAFLGRAVGCTPQVLYCWCRLAAMFGALSWAELSAAHPRYFIAGAVWRPCLERSPGQSCQLLTPGTLLLVQSGGHVWSAFLGRAVSCTPQVLYCWCGLAAMFGALSWAELSAAHPRYFIANAICRPCLERSPGLSCQLHTPGTLLLVQSGGHVWSALLG
jgi:hypothetical protein